MEIIVDLFNQHGGNLQKLDRMIWLSYLNGADVAKIQILNSQRIWGNDLRKFLELTFDEVKQIKAACDSVGIEFMASVFDEEGLEWINELGVKRYKIASVTAFKDKKLCEKILSFDKPTIISAGKYDKEVFPFGFDKNIKYLYCVAEYPALLDHPKIKSLPTSFSENAYYGYSDHTMGSAVGLAAFHRGAKILEKHFTLSHNLQQETQLAHLCSFTPSTLKAFRNLIDESMIFLNK